MYWVKNFAGRYTNINMAYFLGFRRDLSADGYEVFSLSANGEGTVIEKFNTEKEAQSYLDDLIHKAMKGF